MFHCGCRQVFVSENENKIKKHFAGEKDAIIRFNHIKTIRLRLLCLSRHKNTVVVLSQMSNIWLTFVNELQKYHIWTTFANEPQIILYIFFFVENTENSKNFKKSVLGKISTFVLGQTS